MLHGVADSSVSVEFLAAISIVKLRLLSEI